MKKLLKILGIAAGTYLILDIGWIVGVINCDDYHNGRLNPKNKMENEIKEGIEAVHELFGIIDKKDNKLSTKRSKVLSDYARRWAKEGYSSEEIKRGLDLLKKELD